METAIENAEAEGGVPSSSKGLKEKWLQTIDQDQKRKEEETKKDSERSEIKDDWVEREKRKRSMRERIARKMRYGKELEMARTDGLLASMPVGFYITPRRPVAEGDPEW